MLEEKNFKEKNFKPPKKGYSRFIGNIL